MRHNFLILIGILGIILIVGCTNQSSKNLIVAETIDIDIQTPHPYPNSDGDKKVVWSYTLNHSGAPSLGIHFNRFEIKYGEITAPTVFETVDYGPCEKNPEPETQTGQQSGNISVGEQVIPKPCGLVEKKKEYTPQEIFDNNWIDGDFLLIKNKEGNILDIITKSPFFITQGPYDFWTGYSGDTIILELYADNSENGYGIYIDKYRRDFTEEERRRVNDQRFEQYYKDCEERNISRNECMTPK